MTVRALLRCLGRRVSEPIPTTEPEERFFVGVQHPLTLRDPYNPAQKKVLSYQNCPAEALIFRSPDFRGTWLVLPTLDFYGLPWKEWLVKRKKRQDIVLRRCRADRSWEDVRDDEST